MQLVEESLPGIHSVQLVEGSLPGRHSVQLVEGSLPGRHSVQLVEESLPGTHSVQLLSGLKLLFTHTVFPSLSHVNCPSTSEQNTSH